MSINKNIKTGVGRVNFAIPPALCLSLSLSVCLISPVSLSHNVSDICKFSCMIVRSLGWVDEDSTWRSL